MSDQPNRPFSRDEQTTNSRNAQPANPNSLYHPSAIRALQTAKDDLLKAIARIDAAIIADPPPYVPPVVVDSTVKHGAVRSDFAEVYATPSASAQPVGRVAIGGVLPLQADASTDGGYTWWKVTSGEHKGKYVRGTDLTMQAV